MYVLEVVLNSAREREGERVCVCVCVCMYVFKANSDSCQPGSSHQGSYGFGGVCLCSVSSRHRSALTVAVAT